MMTAFAVFCFLPAAALLMTAAVKRPGEAVVHRVQLGILPGEEWNHMATQTLEDRLAAVENELAQIKRQLAAERPQTATAGWEKMFGSFADSEGFEEATRLGREYRRAQNAEADEEAA